MKQLLSVYPPARENWKKFVRNLLTHRKSVHGPHVGGGSDALRRVAVE